jgi:cytidine deaminase
LDREDRVTPELKERLVDAARRARENAYAPYSEYRVGAAIATEDGSIFSGCNVENASYGATICAERTAIVRMVASGGSTPIACAIVVGGDRVAPPCGICRQVLAEFAKDLAVVLVVDTDQGEIREETTLAALLPHRFEL